MVDVDRRSAGLNSAHAAGLRRFSARAAASASAPSTPLPPRTGQLSFASLAHKLIAHLKDSGIRVDSGLSQSEFDLAEAEFGFYFPPDLKAVLAAGLPRGPGFPDWRAAGAARHHLRAVVDLPTASVPFHVARNALWSKSWGPRPPDPETALNTARTALKRAPHLIPVFDHCYIPSKPCLAGNPIFYVDENRIFICGFDLSDFFDRESSQFSRNPYPTVLLKQRSVGEKSSAGLSINNFPRRSLDAVVGRRAPRWVEFWSEATSSAIDRRRRYSNSSSSSSSSPDRYIDVPAKLGMPKWADDYVAQIGSVLREGGWAESDVSEIIHVAASGLLDGEMVILDNEAVLEALLVKADRYSDTLRKAGWSSEEVSDVFGFTNFLPEKGRKPAKEVPRELAQRFGKLAESVNRLPS